LNFQDIAFKQCGKFLPHTVTDPGEGSAKHLLLAFTINVIVAVSIEHMPAELRDQPLRANERFQKSPMRL
jgi:hypothetical protein